METQTLIFRLCENTSWAYQRHTEMLTRYDSHYSGCGGREKSWMPVVNGKSLPKFVFHILSSIHDCFLYLLYLLTVQLISKTFPHFIFYFISFTWIGICSDWSKFFPVSNWHSIQIKVNNSPLWVTVPTDRKEDICNR